MATSLMNEVKPPQHDGTPRSYASPLITANFTIPYKIAAQMPDAIGERNQEATISATPSNQGKFSKAMFVVPFP